MQNPDNCVAELYTYLEKLNTEADKAIKFINAIKKKGKNSVRKAEALVSPEIKQAVTDREKEDIIQWIGQLIEINCNFELADDDSNNFSISYLPIGSNTELKFLTGDNPWNFWLFHDSVDTKSLHRVLLKKYQNEVLDLHPGPKPSESVCFFDRNKVFRGIVLQVINENRVKVVDCDSNISKVVASDKLFKIDPDACVVHASAIKCTISKDPVDGKLWSSDLRDIFCNALKEATLHVEVLERLPGSLPSFLVDVNLRNEDEDCSGNLKEWIHGRVFPELKKVYTDGMESVCDFLSSEALNPYHKGCFNDVTVVDKEITEQDSNVSTSGTPLESESTHNEDTNNLNSESNKLLIKFADNIASTSSEKSSSPETNESSVVSSSVEDCSASPSDSVSGGSVHSKDSDSALSGSQESDGMLNSSSGEFQPIERIPIVQPAARTNKVIIHRAVAPGFYPSFGYHQQGYPQYSTYPPMYCPSPPPVPLRPVGPPWPYQVHNGWSPGNIPPPPNIQPCYSVGNVQNTNAASVGSAPKTWSNGNESHLNKENKDRTSKFANINNISVNVNVMAPEFVPKSSNSSQENLDNRNVIMDINSDKRSLTPAVANEDGSPIVHYEMRKPRSLLKPGENLLVMIAHVESPAEFYVHFITNNNKHLDKLHQEMFEHYNDPTKKVHFSSWREAFQKLGKFCACKWAEDNHWYRVEVLDWAQGDNKVKVYFVDHGNTDEVPLSDIQPLTVQFSKPAMCAQPCHLAQVYPLKKGQTWSEESIKFFKSKVEVSNNKVYSVTVVPSKEKKMKTNYLTVLLYEGKATEDTVSINDMMVDFGMAWSKKLKQQSVSSGSDVYFSLESLSPQSSQVDAVFDSKDNGQDKLFAAVLPDDKPTLELDEVWQDWDPLAEDFNSVRNNPAIDTDDACVAVSGYSAKDESRICKFFARSGHCWKPLCTKEHTLPRKDGVTTDKEEIYCRAFDVMSLPAVGKVIRVRVTAVLSLSLFYVQLSEKRGLGMNNDSEEETLSALAEFINRPENIRAMKHLEISPALGQMVLAKWEGTWYRARVVSPGDTDIEIMFVDFGSVCTVSQKDLREMEPRYLHLPCQAIECSLANIIPPNVGTEDYQKGTSLLRECIESNILTARVYGSDDNDYSRHQVTIQLDDGIDVGEWLVAKKVCRLQPLFSCFPSISVAK